MSANLHKHFYTAEVQIATLLQQFWQKDCCNKQNIIWKCMTALHQKFNLEEKCPVMHITTE